MTTNTALAELKWTIRAAKAPRLRRIAEWVEQEIVLPDGPYAGRRFRCDRQPYTRLLFDEIDSGRWNRAVITGPTQSGKTLSAFIVPTLYHLFEIGESVICGVPSGEIAADKWEVDLKPAIENSRYRDLLPTKGRGSKGGTPTSIRFGNGATLKFMTGGGSDKKRAAFTSRVVVITETDGMDVAGEGSREADKITQIEARTRAFWGRRRIYLECTTSTEDGRTWREYLAGTTSRILLECPHCKAWVTPERENLHGWQSVENVVDAREAGHIQCPECAAAWSDADRTTANQRARLLHRGQEVTPDGEIVGAPPKTDTLGFRWTAANNLFVGAGDVAADEWRAARAEDQDNAEKELRQFVWALPVEATSVREVSLDTKTLMNRVNTLARGKVSPAAKWLTVGIDIGKWLLHWVAVASTENGTAHEVDYGRIEVASQHLPADVAILAALRGFRDALNNGWPRADGPQMLVNQVWIDSRYQQDAVHSFCRESGDRYHPTIGYGGEQGRSYSQPRRISSDVRTIGDGYHETAVRSPGKAPLRRIDIDANHWKTQLQDRLCCPVATSGAITLHSATGFEHLQLARHLTAERRVEEWIAGRGNVVRWEAIRRDNHWLDAFSLATAAQHFCGARVTQSDASNPPRPTTKGGVSWFSQQRKR